MFRQSPSRNQRSKGFKVKHGLQIFLLLAVSVWLLYQIKHSHDKRKAFEESHARLTENSENVREVIKLGRKDLLPQIDETVLNEKHGEEEENDEEESRHEEEVDEDEESKPEEGEEEGRGGGDDEIDEQDQDREDLIDDGDIVNEEKENPKEDADSSDEQDNDRNTQEAREEIYKGDDASSAVARDTQATNTEASGTESVNPDEDKPVETDEATSNLNAAEVNNSVNAGTGEVSLETKQSELGNESQATQSDNHLEVKNGTTTETAQAPALPLLNGTDMNSAQTQDQKSVTSNSSEGNFIQQRLAQEQPKNNSIATGVQQSLTTSEEKPVTSNAAAGGDNHSTVNESGDRDPSEKPETNARTGESDDNSAAGGNEDEVLNVPVDSSKSTTPLDEERESRTDLGTLPETQNEGTDSEDIAAE